MKPVTDGRRAQRQRSRRVCIATPILAVSVLALIGCGASSPTVRNGPQLSYADFVVAPGEVSQENTSSASIEHSEGDDETAEVEPSIAGAGAAASGAPSEEDSATSPAVPRAARVEPGRPVVVDSLVGQINGRPVYANEFFAPIDDKIRLMREQMSPRQFDLALQREVSLRLQQILFSELFLAEAESKLTPQQQQGLLAWLTRQREDIISQKGGASAVAELRLEEEGIEGGVDQYVQSERDKALIQMLLQQEVRPRVIISWRDIEQRYKRDFEQYNPPGSATVAWIALTPGSDDEKIAEVKRRLADGESFIDVARDFAIFGDGILAENLSITDEGLASAEGLNPIYREKLTGLDAGDTTEPFIQTREGGGEWLVWLHIAEIVRPDRRSLYDTDVQLQIRDQLYSERFLIEQQRFAEELLDQSIQKDLTTLSNDLVRIAELRYD